MGEDVLTVLEAPTADRDDLRSESLVNAVALALVTPGAWQVCDSRLAVGTEGHLLGFVQERHGDFEVMQLADEFRWCAFPSMRAAIAYIVATNDEVMDARSRGTLGWILGASATTRSMALSFSPGAAGVSGRVSPPTDAAKPAIPLTRRSVGEGGEKLADAVVAVERMP